MITVGIPLYNGASTIKGCLDRLTLMNIPNLNVIVYDNGSDDGSNGLLGELAGTKYYLRTKKPDTCTLNLTYFQGHHEKQHPYENAMRTRKLIAKLCKDEYIFFLDPDVILPPNSLNFLMEEFKKTNDMYMGIRYQPSTTHDHVGLGATLWKTADFLSVPDEYDARKGCDCLYTYEFAKKAGRSPEYHSWLQGYHCKVF